MKYEQERGGWTLQPVFFFLGRGGGHSVVYGGALGQDGTIFFSLCIPSCGQALE